MPHMTEFPFFFFFFFFLSSNKSCPQLSWIGKLVCGLISWIWFQIMNTCGKMPSFCGSKVTNTMQNENSLIPRKNFLVYEICLLILWSYLLHNCTDCIKFMSRAVQKMNIKDKIDNRTRVETYLVYTTSVNRLPSSESSVRKSFNGKEAKQ